MLESGAMQHSSSSSSSNRRRGQVAGANKCSISGSCYVHGVVVKGLKIEAAGTGVGLESSSGWVGELFCQESGFGLSRIR